MSSQTETYLTLPQLAIILNVTGPTVQTWMRKGRAPACVKARGGRALFKIADVERFIAAHVVERSGGEARATKRAHHETAEQGDASTEDESASDRAESLPSQFRSRFDSSAALRACVEAYALALHHARQKIDSAPIFEAFTHAARDALAQRLRPLLTKYNRTASVSDLDDFAFAMFDLALDVANNFPMTPTKSS